jgi:4'-phosphopantetheinyl transferase
MKNPAQNQILKPVILPVPEKVREWHARDRVVFLSEHAREALSMSAEKSGIELGELAKNTDGIPLPSKGFYWSVTHKPKYVAAVVSSAPAGIDLEEIRDIHSGLYRRVAGEEEWQLMPDAAERKEMFFRFWTAKEAVMKAAGTGIKDLSRIRIHRVHDEKNMDLFFQDKTWKVQQYFFDDHITAITANDLAVEWSLLENQ